MAREAEYWGLTAKRCDSCKSSPSVLFCRADAAYLCGECDSRVHAANALASRHERVWLCEVCEHAPASVTCKADAATLCTTCDADIHAANPLARRHERVPVVPFYDLVSAAVKPSSDAINAGVFSCGDVDDEVDQSEAAKWMKAKGMMMEAAAAGPDLNFTDVDPYLDLDYADGLVPVHGKPVAGSGVFGGGAPPMIVPDGVVEFDFALGKPSYSSYNAHSLSQSMSSSEVGVVPDGGSGSTMADVSNPSGLGQAPNPNPNPTVATMDREARVMRYREKRKKRKFEKTIRYASRKAYAETRPRIKGRFAKRVEMDSDADPIYSSAAAAAASFMVDINGYGVVPSF